MKAMFVGGKLNGMEFKDVNEVLDILPCEGYTEDLSEIRKQDGFVCREELDNQPIFEGYLSPMWDGNGLRYETEQVYNIMSI